MEERSLDISYDDEYVCIALQGLDTDVFSRDSGVSWLIIGDDFYVDITQDIGQDNKSNQRIVVRIAAGDFPRKPDGSPDADTARLMNARLCVDLVPVVQQLGPKEGRRGHISTIHGSAIHGWVTDPANLDADLPVEAGFAGRSLLTMSQGNWVRERFRKFVIPIPHDVSKHVPIRTTIRTAPDGAAFSRSPLIITLTSLGWLMASQMRHKKNVLEGEFLLASAPAKSVTVCLALASGISHTAKCSEATAVKFDGRSCGFKFENLTEDDLEDARLLISHSLLKGSEVDLDLKEFL